MGVALIDTVPLGTVHSLPSSLADTHSPLAHPLLAAVVLAHPLFTLFASVAFLAVTVSFVTDAFAVAVSGTDLLGTVRSSEDGETLAPAVNTVAVASTVGGTEPDTAVHLFVIRVAEAEAVLAEPVAGTAVRTGRVGTVLPDEALGALALALHADAVMGTVVGTVLVGTV